MLHTVHSVTFLMYFGGHHEVTHPQSHRPAWGLCTPSNPYWRWRCTERESKPESTCRSRKLLVPRTEGQGSGTGQNQVAACTHPDFPVLYHVGSLVVPPPRNSAGCPSLGGISHHPLFDQVEAWLSGKMGSIIDTMSSALVQGQHRKGWVTYFDWEGKGGCYRSVGLT